MNTTQIINDVIVLNDLNIEENKEKKINVESFSDEWQAFNEMNIDHYSDFNNYFDLVDLSKMQDKIVADFGCGIGRWTKILNEKIAPKYNILIDYSDSIYVARKNLKKIDNSIFIKADIETINFKKKSIGIYSILIAIGITKGIQKLLSLDIQLKWPNDLYIENKKIGGILIESKLNNNNLILNIGFGINVNENPDDFPEDIINYATSLKTIYGQPIQRELLLANILNSIDQLLQNINPLQLAEEWNKGCLNIDKSISFNYKSQIRTGIFKKINSKGQSIIEYNKEKIIFDGAIIQS